METEEHHFVNFVKLQKIAYRASMKLNELLLECTLIDRENPKNPLNNIRKCQYCGEVWMKVYGCDGETICGQVYKGKD